MQALKILGTPLLRYEQYLERKYQVDNNAFPGLSISAIEVLGDMPEKKIVGDAIITFVITKGLGDFWINGFHHAALKNRVFVVKEGEPFSCDSTTKGLELHIIRHIFSRSGEYSIEYVNPPKALADCSPNQGKAVIYSGNDTFLLNLNEKPRLQLAGNTNLGMWMQGTSEIVRDVNAGSYPFRKVSKFLKENAQK